ncbi:hypothetical protein Nepgr_004839 [Nepenthes gracilis]|uniref:OCRE domain-containing protein n=1 Tax=Nepenthes gracilis TaxID=150966 RepID=A0AAD3XFQ7_NEPGR|nr:hypothetical protein Nepgr_004839 [Nepenthes gracilis]
MPFETKLIFDLLTEDAMKLMGNGYYNVYHAKQEIFDREAGKMGLGTRRICELTSGKRNGPSFSEGIGNCGANAPNHSHMDGSTSAAPLSDGADTYDMFADEDAAANHLFEGRSLASASNHHSSSLMEVGHVNQDYDSSLAGQKLCMMILLDTVLPTFSISLLCELTYLNEPQIFEFEVMFIHSVPCQLRDLLADTSIPSFMLYTSFCAVLVPIFSPSWIYNYSSNLGYCYDPSSGLYFSAMWGQWYPFNEESGTYAEIQDAVSNAC